jgi:hypothetical protein
MQLGVECHCKYIGIVLIILYEIKEIFYRFKLRKDWVLKRQTIRPTQVSDGTIRPRMPLVATLKAAQKTVSYFQSLA